MTDITTTTSCRTRRNGRAGRRLAEPLGATALAAVLALACAHADAALVVSVHADFPASGFAQGPVYGSVGPQAFDVEFIVDETAAVRYPAGFEVSPGQVVMGQDVYAFGYGAILSASSFTFGTQTFSGMSLHNLSYALLFNGIVSAPLFLTDITPGSTPLMDAIAAPSAGLGWYDFSPFVPGTLQTAFLTNRASVFDGTAEALGTVRVSIFAVPEPGTLSLLLLGLLPLALGRRPRPRASAVSAAAPERC